MEARPSKARVETSDDSFEHNWKVERLCDLASKVLDSIHALNFAKGVTLDEQW